MPFSLYLRTLLICYLVNEIKASFLARNGSGKSTFIKLFMSKLSPLDGWVHSPANFRIGYVAQHHLDQLDMEASPLEFLLKHYPGNRSMSHENDMRRYLASFGLGGVTLPVQKIKTLSGGQKVSLRRNLSSTALLQIFSYA